MGERGGREDSSLLPVAAVIPARNEEPRLGQTLAALTSLALDDLVVVDDGSTDGTAEVAADGGARVLRLYSGLGKGRAMEVGWRSVEAEIILFLDADLEASAARLGSLIEAVREDRADLAIASFSAGGGGLGLASGTARRGIRWLTGYEAQAPLSGQRAVRRSLLERIAPLAPGFGVEVAMTVDALRLGYRVVEVPLQLHHRVTGRDLAGFLHRGRQLVAILRVLAGQR